MQAAWKDHVAALGAELLVYITLLSYCGGVRLATTGTDSSRCTCGKIALLDHLGDMWRAYPKILLRLCRPVNFNPNQKGR